MSLLITLLAAVAAVSGIYLMREKLRGRSSTSYTILAVTTTISLSMFLFNLYVAVAELPPTPTVIHQWDMAQQLFSVIGFNVVHYRMWVTFKHGFCNKAYACPIADDLSKPRPIHETTINLPANLSGTRQG